MSAAVDRKNYPTLNPDRMPECTQYETATNVWIETYRRDETNDIRVTVDLFIKWLRDNGLERVYLEHWGAR